MGTHEHKAAALRHLRVAILTVSTTRSIKEDKSGQWMARRAAREGHQVVDHRVVTDDAPALTSNSLNFRKLSKFPATTSEIICSAATER